jgi:hypothetical protein
LLAGLIFDAGDDVGDRKEGIQSASTNGHIQNHLKAYNQIPLPSDQGVVMMDIPSNDPVLAPKAAPRRRRRAAEKASAAWAGLSRKKQRRR